MIVNNNAAVYMSLDYAFNTDKNLTKSLNRLSSGLQINKASDDASGLSIADKLRTQASSITQSIDNGNSAVSLTQIADKAMAEQSNILDTVKQKLIQAGTATTSSAGREAIAKDVNKLLDQMNNIAVQTNYNGIQLLQAGTSVNSASGASSLSFQMGETNNNTINTASGVQANVTGLSLTTLKTAVSGTAAASFSASQATTAMATVDTALDTLNGWRSDIGSTQNQLESAIRNMMTQKTNILAAESVIRDVDYAEESANFSKLNIFKQANYFGFSQANAHQENVLRLLQ